jgi:GTPase
MARRRDEGLSTEHLALPLVALVGRPNVGKSTLWNRVCGSHHAIVEDEPGVTRDRRYGEAEWDGRIFRVVDTGGLDPGLVRRAPAGEASIARGVYRQAMRAVEEADLIVFVIDGRAGLAAGDQEAAEILRKTGRPMLFAANKVDRAALEPDAHELYKLGADEVFAISAQHGRGVGELLDAILERLPAAPRVLDLLGDVGAVDDGPRAGSARRGEAREALPSEGGRASPPLKVRIAIVGRPNAGKSSLLNHFAGEERVLVDPQAGTTRDPVDLPVVIDGRDYVLIDTAGIRRRARVHAPMEKVAVAMAEKAIGRADVCVLLIDAQEGIGEQDAKIAGLCEEAGRALVIAFNKIDLLADEGRKQRDKLIEDLKRQIQFVPWAKVVFLSAKTGKGTRRLLDAVNAAYAAFTTRVSTGALNRWFSAIVEKHPPSLYRGHPVRLYYIQQPQAAPPTFILSVNHADGVHFSYRRYLANQLREAFHLDGTPVRLVCRGRGEKAKQPELVRKGARRPRADA